MRWKYKSTSVPTDIVRIGENIFFGSFQDRWSAVNLHTGKLVWEFSTGASNETCAMVNSPVADESYIYLTGLDGLIYSLDAKSGRVAWKRRLPASPSTALILIGDSLFVGTGDKRIFRLKSQTGDTQFETLVEARPVGRPASGAGAIFFFLQNESERTGDIVSVAQDLSKINWSQKSSPDWASERPHLNHGSVLAGNCRGELASFRSSNGTPEWKLNLKGCIRSIGNSDGLFFVGVQEGTVYALRH